MSCTFRAACPTSVTQIGENLCHRARKMTAAASILIQSQTKQPDNNVSQFAFHRLHFFSLSILNQRDLGRMEYSTVPNANCILRCSEEQQQQNRQRNRANRIGCTQVAFHSYACIICISLIFAVIYIILSNCCVCRSSPVVMAAPKIPGSSPRTDVNQNMPSA